MAIIHADWYAANEGRQYPLDDAATAADGDGVRLPADIVADLSLRWPDAYGRFAFLAAVAVTTRIATLSFEAADDLDDPSSFRPLAVATVTSPFSIRRHVRLLPQADGVAGWVVFGNGIRDRPGYRGRFGPRAGLLAPRSARAYRALPVTGLRSLAAGQLLDGVVALKAEPPLYARSETRVIEGVTRDVVVIGLTESAAGGFLPGSLESLLPASNESVFQRFAGPCAGRPESGSCGDPEPIEFVSTVQPDCDGRLTLEIRGFAYPAPLEDSAIIVESQQGVSATCTPDYLADSLGRLPDEGD